VNSNRFDFSIDANNDLGKESIKLRGFQLDVRIRLSFEYVVLYPSNLFPPYL